MGRVKIGGAHPVSIQSMTKTDTADVHATVMQIKALEKAGCEIVRVAVKNSRAAEALSKIKSKINIPLVADIHFNYQLALQALEAGVDGLRLNPGNIYRKTEVKEIVKLAKQKKVPIRVGINSGSLRTRGLEVHSLKLASEMVKSARSYIKMLESFNFYDIIISLKSADVETTVAAYKKMASVSKYPLHLGVTAAGLPEDGAVKSAIGIGALLLNGIGDTIRVSLAGDPSQEVKTAQQILQSLGLRNFGPEVIVCPTCGRTQVDVVKIAKSFKNKLSKLKGASRNLRNIKIAIMGCEVNGPGEVKGVDLGVACGKKSAVLFKKGKIVKKIKEREVVDTLIKELIKLRGKHDR